MEKSVWKAIVLMKKVWESNLLEMFMLFQFEKSLVSGKTQVLQEMAYEGDPISNANTSIAL